MTKKYGISDSEKSLRDFVAGKRKLKTWTVAPGSRTTRYKSFAELLEDRDRSRKIKDARHKLGMTQKAMALAIRTNFRTLQDWELGRVQPTPIAMTLTEVMLHFPDVVEHLTKSPTLAPEVSRQSRGRDRTSRSAAS